MRIVITQIKIRLNNDTANVKAYASVVFNESIKINGIRIETNYLDRLVVRFPFSESKHLQYVVPLNDAVRQYIDKQIIERYYETKKAAYNRKAQTQKAQEGNPQKAPKFKTQEGNDENGN